MRPKVLGSWSLPSLFGLTLPNGLPGSGPDKATPVPVMQPGQESQARQARQARQASEARQASKASEASEASEASQLHTIGGAQGLLVESPGGRTLCTRSGPACRSRPRLISVTITINITVTITITSTINNTMYIYIYI